jgi:hypothetical protein
MADLTIFRTIVPDQPAGIEPRKGERRPGSDRRRP